MKTTLHWSALVIACWSAGFLGSYTYNACVRIYHAFENVTVPNDGMPAMPMSILGP